MYILNFANIEHEETVTTEDDDGNEMEETITTTETILHIDLFSKTHVDMIAEYQIAIESECWQAHKKHLT